MLCNTNKYIYIQTIHSTFLGLRESLCEDLHRVARLSVSDPNLIGCEKSGDKLLGFSWQKFNLWYLKCLNILITNSTGRLSILSRALPFVENYEVSIVNLPLLSEHFSNILLYKC